MIKRIQAMGLILLVLSGLVILGGTALSASASESPDAFVHEDVHIPPDQVIGRLLVSNGNAVIEGNVTEGVIIVDGDVIVRSGAYIKGMVVVIGGNIAVEPGANMEAPAWVILPRGYPLATLLVGSLLIIGAASLIILPILIWLMGRWFKRTSLYLPLKEFFQVVQRRWPALYIIASLVISGLMLTGLMVLAWETIFRNTMGFADNLLIWLVRYFASPMVDKVMIAITNLGFGSSYIIVVVVSFLLLTYYRRWWEIAGLAICLTGGSVLNVLLKHLFQRSRPDLFQVVQATGYSFPSGHAMVSLCFYGMLTFLIIRTIPSWRGRLAVLTLAVILIVLIGISRIYLGVHYPTDVIAGYAAGSMWLAFCISLLMWWELEREKR